MEVVIRPSSDSRTHSLRKFFRSIKLSLVLPYVRGQPSAKFIPLHASARDSPAFSRSWGRSRKPSPRRACGEKNAVGPGELIAFGKVSSTFTGRYRACRGFHGNGVLVTAGKDAVDTGVISWWAHVQGVDILVSQRPCPCFNLILIHHSYHLHQSSI